MIYGFISSLDDETTKVFCQKVGTTGICYRL